jgi:hypothetical protein
MANNKEKKVYRDGLGKITNPATTLFGKILIWFLAISMVAGIIFTAVFLIAKMF